MPDYDLGVAHGEIRFDYDDNSAKQATTSLKNFERTVEAMNTHLGKIEQSLNNLEDQFKSLSSAVSEADREVDGFGSSVLSAGRNFRLFNGDLQSTVKTLGMVYSAFDRAQHGMAIFNKTSEVFGESLRRGGGPLAFASAAGNLGLFTAGLRSARNAILGINNSMARLPNSIRYIKLMGDGMQAMAGTAAKLSSTLAGGAFVNFGDKLYKSLLPANKILGRFSARLYNEIATGTNQVNGPLGKLRNSLLAASSASFFFSRSFGKMEFFRPFLNKIQQSTVGINRLSDKVLDLGANFSQQGVSISKFVRGLGTATNGATAFYNRFSAINDLFSGGGGGRWAIGARALGMFGAFGGIGATVDVAAKSLIWFGQTLQGVWSGIKQLSGGILALPGAFATLGAAASTAGVIFKGLSDKFKDLFSDDPTERWEAFFKLPDHLKPIGKELLKLREVFKNFQEVVQTTFLVGAEKQISKLSEVYLPSMQKGMVGVANEMKNTKDRFVEFLLQGQTQGDINALFIHTQQIMGSLAASTKPVLEGFRDIGVVGSDFTRQMAQYLPVLSIEFSKWAAANRENGNLMGWMQGAVAGARDLGSGLKNAAEGVWSILTAFKRTTNENALQNFADSMESFNRKIQESAAGGLLREWGDAIRDMGTDRLKGFLDDMGKLAGKLDGVIPIIKDFANTFGEVLSVSLQGTASTIQGITAVLGPLGPLLGTVTGAALAWIASFKLAPPIFRAMKDAAMVAWGTISIFKNGASFFDAVSTAALKFSDVLGKMGPLGKGVADRMLNITSGSQTLITKLGSIAAVGVPALAAIAAGFFLWKSASDKTSKSLDQIIDRRADLAQMGVDLRKAFIDDSGVVGKAVTDTLSNNVDELFRDVSDQAKNIKSVWDHLGDQFDIGERENPFSQTIEFNQSQKIADDAARAKQQFDNLNLTVDDLSKSLLLGEEEWIKYSNHLRKAEGGGDEAADAIGKLREQTVRARVDAEKLGEGGAKLAKGIQLIAEAGADATQRLSAFKLILEGLGLDESSSFEAAIAYADAVDQLAESASNAAANVTDFSNLMDPITGKLNKNSEAGRELARVLIPVADNFQSLVATGSSSADAMAQLEPQIQAVADAFKTTPDKIRQFMAQLGANPEILDIAVQIQGKGPVVQDLAQLLLAMQAKVGQGVEVPIGVAGGANSVAQRINGIVGAAVARAEGNNVVLDADIPPEVIQKVKQELVNLGVQIPGMAPVQPNKMPIQPDVKKDERVYTGGKFDEGDRSYGGGNFDEGLAEEQEKIREKIQQQIDQAVEAGKTGGEAFSSNFADGIRSNIDKIDQAAKEAADAAAKKMPGSPAKEGPLSGSGWSRYGGEAFSSDFASGIEAKAAAVGTAATGVAGTAMGSLRSDQAFQTGQFLGQLSRIMGFAENLVNVAGKVGDIVTRFGKFISDPMGKGTFFGQRRPWKRDTSLSETEVAQRRDDAAQARASAFYGSGQRPDVYDPTTGRIKSSVTPGELRKGAGQQEIANYVIDKAMSLGYSREQANKFLIQAVGESGLNSAANGGNQSGAGNVLGIFQFDPPTWKDAGGGDITDVQQNIDNYMNLAAIRGLSPETFKSGEQLGEQVSIGGPWHPDNQAKGHLTQAQQEAQKFIDNYKPNVGQVTTGVAPGTPAIPGNAPASKKLDTGPGLEPVAGQLAAFLEQQFPGITRIGGQENRPKNEPQIHTQGRALDVGIGSNVDLGQEIYDFLAANPELFGIQNIIWKDTGTNFATNESGPAGSTWAQNDGGKHWNHLHIQFADGAKMDVGPDGTARMNVPANSPYAGADFGLPPKPEEFKNPPKRREDVVVNPDGTTSPVHGTGAEPGPGSKTIDWNGEPWTLEKSEEFWNRPENRERLDQSLIRPGDTTAQGVFQGTQDQMLQAFKDNNPDLAKAIAVAEDYRSSESDTISAIQSLEVESDRQLALGTAEGRVMAQQLGSVINTAATDKGLVQEANPFDTASSIASSATSVAGDIFNVLNSAIESVGATKNITGQLVRGVSNTEDIFNMVDDIQKFLELGSSIAGAVSSVSGLIGGIAGAAGSAGGPAGGGAGAALQGVSVISGLVQAGFDTANAIIDLAQEAYRIVGSYVGDFLGYLVGGPGGPLGGDVKFLLDTQTKELLAYSADNPLDKRSHDVPFSGEGTARQQSIGQINVYGGPGSDPRDDTRQMMFQVKAAGFAGATAQ